VNIQGNYITEQYNQSKDENAINNAHSRHNEKIYRNEKSAQRDANTARAGCSKVLTPPARHKHTDRTDYNTLHR